MRFTTRTEYALLALIHLARHREDTHIPLNRIATEQGIPLKFLEQIAMALTRANILSSLKGPHGGYKLARPADTITLAEIVRLLDGPLAPTSAVSRFFYKTSPIEKEAKMVVILKEIHDYVTSRMEALTLADVI